MKSMFKTQRNLISFLGAVALTASTVLAQAAQPSVDMKKAPEVDLSKESVLYIVGYAHLDTQWRWAYPQVIREYIPDTLRNNFPLFEKYPHYVFNFSGSRRYEMMREYYPEDYEKLKKYVAEGRWFPCGSSVDENDANVPSAESFVRQVLYGNQYFRKEFGKASDEFMLPDCFGFPAALPSMLAHCGIKGFSTQKLTWGSAVGVPFKVGVWEGVDGTSVLAALDPGAYVGEIRENLANSRSWTRRIKANGDKSGVYADYHYYGTGDRGGAPTEDSVKMAEESVKTKGAIRVISGPADWLFHAISSEMAKNLPRYKGELLLTEHSAGSITSQSYMKRWNRKNELLAFSAEAASVGAMLLGNAPYPGDAIYQAWDLVLGSQMHDILPGTSLPKAYEYSWNDEVLAANKFETVLKQGVSVIAATLDTRVQGIPLVVYNPLSVDREDVVEATVSFPNGAPSSVTVYGPDGAALPTQIVGTSGTDVKVLFLAKMPSVGFATFDVRTGGAPAGGDLKVDEKSLENSRYRVTLDGNGDVASIIDKANGNKELLAGPAQLEFLYERPQQYPAWNMDWADRQKPPRARVTGPAKVRVVEKGPVRVTLEVEREAEGSKFIQRIRLAAGAAGDRVEYDTQIDWRSKEVSLKQAFPLAVSNPTATYELQVGAIERGNNDPKKYEVPAHKWFDLTDTGGSYGVSVLNDSKFGSDKPSDNTLRLTLLYTPGVRNDYQDQATQDFGRHDMLYAIQGHAGDWRQGKTAVAAARMNQPLRAFKVDAHEGSTKSLSLFKVDQDQVSISAIKKAENGNGVIVRLRELTGKPATGVKLSAMAGITSAREVDGQERPIGNANVADGSLVTDVRGFGLKAFELQLASTPKATLATSTPVALSYDTDVISSNAKLTDGAMDAAGRSYPAEQFLKSVTNQGVTFTMGPTGDGQNNAVTAKGQTIQLPDSSVDRVYVLAASSEGDVDTAFDVAGKKHAVRIQSWDGYVGQFDNRLWGGTVPELTFAWHNPLVGLAPGFVKPAPVAWYCSHHHTLKGDAYYLYSYLFAYEIAVPAGTKSITLPNDPRVKVFAVSAVSGGPKPVTPAAPLFDTLNDRVQDAPTILAPTAAASDTLPVKIQFPLYYRPGSVRYTLDGSEPTANSPVYEEAILVNDTKTLKVRSFDNAGKGGTVVSKQILVKDTTAPKIVAASSVFDTAHIAFSEPVDKAAAETVSNYSVAGGTVTSAKLDADGKGVSLTMAGSISGLKVRGIKDLSPAANALPEQDVVVKSTAPIFTVDSYVADGKSGKEIRPESLPVKANEPWTLNLFVRVQEEPETRAIIAGFGSVADKRGQGKYLAKFVNGVHHWTSNTDLEGSVPFEIGKWQMLTTTFDGKTMRLFNNGQMISERQANLPADEAVVNLAPLDPWEKSIRFKGEIRNMTIWKDGLSPEAVRLLYLKESTK